MIAVGKKCFYWMVKTKKGKKENGLKIVRFFIFIVSKNRKNFHEKPWKAIVHNWAAKQQTSLIIAHWRFSVSPWWIYITFVWPRGSLKLTEPSSQLGRHLHFELIRLCLALLFIISMLDVKTKKKKCLLSAWILDRLLAAYSMSLYFQVWPWSCWF